MTRLTTRTTNHALADEEVLFGASHVSEIDHAVVVAGLQGQADAGRIPNGSGRYGIAVAGREGTARSLYGGVATAGQDGVANCGADGVAVVPKRVQPIQAPGQEPARALAAGGDGAVAVAGEGAFASVGRSAIAFARQDGAVRGSRGALLIIVHRINQTSRGFVVGQAMPLAEPGDTPVPGAQPLDADVWYRLDAKGRFVRA